MFSQISASERDKSVPSPTCIRMSCSIANASGSVALRANMGCSCIHRECVLRFLQRRPNLQWSSTPRYVVYSQNLLQLQCTVKTLIGGYAAAREVFERELLEFAASLHAELHSLADHFVCNAERHSATNKARRTRQRVHKAASGSFLHARIIECHARHEPGCDLYDAADLLCSRKYRLLRLLHIFVVSQRKASHR